MKKLFTAFALIMGLGTTVAFAENIMLYTNPIVTIVNEFTPIDVKELPQIVLDAINRNYNGKTVKSATYEANENGTAVYQTILTDAESNETIATFNEKGEELK